MRSIILILLLLIPFAHATTLVDVTTGQPIANASVTVIAGSASSEYLTRPGDELELPAFPVQAQLLVHKDFSPDITHAAVIPANVTPQTVLVYPAGILRLTVKDGKDNAIGNASVNITCSRLIASGVTDRSGGFIAVLPAEDCMLSVVGKVAAGERIIIRQGITDRTVTLEEQKPVSYAWLLGIAAIIAAVVIAVIIPKRRYVASEVKQALTPKEKLIVDQLIARGGKASLPDLRAHVRIPRTSLLRTLEGLEHRGVLMRKTANGKVIVELLR